MKNLLLSLMFLFPVSAMAQDKPSPEKSEPKESIEDRIKRLVEELGNDSYQIREKAHQALEKIGKPALEALKKAYKSLDLEVSSRAQELIERITGKRIKPESKPKEDTPTTPMPPRARNGEQPVPELPFDPDDMKKMLDKLKDFEGLSPNLKDSLDSIRKLLEGTEKGVPDLSEMGKLFEKLFNKKLPGMPESKPRQTPKIGGKFDVLLDTSELEKDLGLKVDPTSETLRQHLYILPRSGAKPRVALKYGLVVKTVDKNGHAFAAGLRPHDIIIFIGTEVPPKIPLPGPEVDWNQWRAKSLVAGKAEQLEILRTKKAYLEVIRQGKPCQVIEVRPLNSKKKSETKTKDF